MILDGASVALQNNGSGTSTLASVNSGVLIKSAGDISNGNTLIQGNTSISANSDSLGAVTLNAGGNVLNQTTPGSQLGILFGQNGDVSVNAAGNITNRNARILSNQQVALSAGGDLFNIIDHADGVGAGTPVTYSSRGTRWLVFSKRESGMSVDYGEVIDPARLAYITADAGSVKITANNVVNAGGSILTDQRIALERLAQFLDPCQRDLAGPLAQCIDDEHLCQRSDGGRSSPPHGQSKSAR
ncbi:hypothetical protein LMG19083_03901 [Ralstonia psammae]|uniref:Uncharacterized protein n=1 Tax=Ralstonia psammae TaxID=3058598 RepID=A0ABM9JT82_9RALS|nr:hypothetical protein [Ralstonia sp. LMG 19083]CAJ0803525.1 hypothetical protein LMG19083_03901 [Ralstonia sp. LMG 19083]